LIFDNFTISVRNSQLLDPSEQKIGEIALGQFHRFILFFDHAADQFRLFFQRDLVFAMTGGASARFLSIGSSKLDTPFHFLVGVRTIVSTDDHWDEVMKLPANETSWQRHGASVLVPCQSYIRLLSERQVLYKVFDSFETAANNAEFGFLLPILLAVARCGRRRDTGFHTQLRYSVSLRAENCDLINLIWLTNVILGYEQDDRNRLFSELFLDIGFFSRLGPELLTNFVDFLAEILEATSQLLDINSLCEKGLLKFAGLYVILTQNTVSGSSFYRCLKALSMGCSPQHLDSLNDLVQAAGIWTLRVPFTLTGDSFENLTLAYARTSQAQFQICSLILEVEANRDLTILDDDLRLALAYLIPRSIAVGMLDGILKLCASDTFVNNNMMMLTGIFSRFLEREGLWRSLFGLMVNDPNFAFGAHIGKVTIRRPLFSMMIRLLCYLVTNENRLMVARVLVSMHSLITGYYWLLFEKDVAPSFVCFVRGGQTELYQEIGRAHV
jgi:hypothetical protein